MILDELRRQGSLPAELPRAAGATPPDASARAADPAARERQRIVAALLDEPLSRDQLGRRLERSPEQLCLALLELELAGRVAEDRDGRLRVVAEGVPRSVRRVRADGASRRSRELCSMARGGSMSPDSQLAARRLAVVGAGLAGCEAAWQAACRGLDVTLYEMKPLRFSPAHASPDFAELVCSNSLRSNVVTNAVGLLKEEMRRLGSLVLDGRGRDGGAGGPRAGRGPRRLRAAHHRDRGVAPAHRGASTRWWSGSRRASA